MLHLDGGHALRRIIDELESLSYKWAYRVVNTLAFGLPQRRERVFLLATLHTDPTDALLSEDMVPPKTYTRLDTHAHGFYWTEGIRGLGWAPDAVPTLKNGSTVGIPSPPAILLPNLQIATPELRDVERLQGLNQTGPSPRRRGAGLFEMVIDRQCRERARREVAWRVAFLPEQL
jgi:DNA (cytosine-5)-methyltransferase 1